MVKMIKSFSAGEAVFVKVRGYPPWPAKIDSITDAHTKNAKFHVLFYGTGETGQCKIEDIYPYAENKDKFIAKNGKRKHYVDGIQQLESENQFPPSETSAAIASDDTAAMDTSSETQENAVSHNSVTDDPVNVADDLVANADSLAAPSTESEMETASVPTTDEGEKKKGTKRKTSQATTPSEIEIKKKKSRKSLSSASSMATPPSESTPKFDKPVDSPQQDPTPEGEDLETKKGVSRSGRKIKPKRFHDFADGEAALGADSMRNDQTPQRFKDKKLNEPNENSESTPVNPPIKKRINVEKMEKKAIKEDEDVTPNQFKIKSLRNELKLIYLDSQIRSSLSLVHADTENCLEAMDQLFDLELNPLMLKKHPHVIETIKRLRRYIGNMSDWKLSEEDTIKFKRNADLIRKKAEEMYKKLRELFGISDAQPFWDTFMQKVNEFNELTKNKSKNEVFSILVDPATAESESMRNGTRMI